MKILLLLVWTVACFYLGIAGYARVELDQKIQVKSTDGTGNVACGTTTFQTLEDCLIYERDKNTNKLFPWVFSIPSFLGIMIVTVFFGSLGGVIKILQEITLDNKTVNWRRSTLLPFFGGLMGLIILGISYVLPTAITESDIVLRPLTLLFISLFAGAFSDKAFRWADNRTNLIFNIKPEAAK